MVSDDDVAATARDCRVGGPSASRYFLTAPLWIPNSRSIALDTGPEKEGLVHLVGLAVIIAGVVASSANDIMRLIEGGQFVGG